MEVLKSPPLVPSSMSSGGETHTNELAQSGPGSLPVTPMPDPSLNVMHLEVNQGLPVDTEPNATDQWLEDPSGAHHTPRDPSNGRFTAGSGSGWVQVQGISR